MGGGCVLVIGIIVWFADPATSFEPRQRAEDSYYNLLAQSISTGQLNLNKPVPAGLAKLSDPYDPIRNAPYITNLVDLSYYKGKLYLYFGITPVLVFFWPYAVMTGHYASDKAAVVIFYTLGFLVALALLRAIWRRYFSDLNFWPAALGMFVLGLAMAFTFWCNTNEVAITCGFAFMMLALAGIWRALHEPNRAVVSLALASLAYGLAVGARPSLLFGIVILLVPVVFTWLKASGPGSHRKVFILLAAAVGPVAFVGLGLALYNSLRFGNPLEFGWHYQLMRDYRPTTIQQFSPHYLWFNCRFYFFEGIRCNRQFPFLEIVPLPSMPAGYDPLVGGSDGGILANYPIVLLALAVPLVWRSRSPDETSVLKWFLAILVFLFLVFAVTICLLATLGVRYEMDFLPQLLLLAIVGILGLERALAHLPVWRWIMRASVLLLLVYSLVFNFLLNTESRATAYYFAGNSFVSDGHFDEAIVQYQKALALWPDSPDANAGLGNVFFQKRQIDQAIVQYQKALEIKPHMAETCNNLGDCFLQKGRLDDAIVQYQNALEIMPGFPEAHANLGFCLLREGRVDGAIIQYQKAVDLQPNFPQAYNNLGNAFRLNGNGREAVAAYQKAIEQQPEFILPQTHLAWMLATWPDASIRDGKEALALAKKADVLSQGSDPQVLRTLAAAYAEVGQFVEAVSTAQKALALAMAQSNDALAGKLRTEIGLYQNHSPCRSND